MQGCSFSLFIDTNKNTKYGNPNWPLHSDLFHAYFAIFGKSYERKCENFSRIQGNICNRIQTANPINANRTAQQGYDDMNEKTVLCLCAIFYDAMRIL